MLRVTKLKTTYPTGESLAPSERLGIIISIVLLTTYLALYVVNKYLVTTDLKDEASHSFSLPFHC